MRRDFHGWRRDFCSHLPKEKVAQIHDFATDLAVGFDEGAWSTLLAFHQGVSQWTKKFIQVWMVLDETQNEHVNSPHLKSKWERFPTQPNDLLSLAYIRHLQGNGYALTEKAFDACK